MIIETERLKLAALNAEQLALWTEDLAKLEAELCCKYLAEPLEGHFLDIIKSQAKITAEDPQNYPWHGFWWIIDKESGKVVGSSDFKDLPDEHGDTEIGYGLGKQFEHRGYMTETVSAMCSWAFEHGAARVIAETEKWNEPSQAVLKRCGFTKYSEDETMWWEKKK
jgi:ribosomal-protein-alanine N-acetyltransferase